MKTTVLALAALAASVSFSDSRVMTVDGDGVRGGMNVVTNVDLSGFVTDVSGKLDSKSFVWSGTNQVTGAEYSENAKRAKSADLSTRALQVDTMPATKLTQRDSLFNDLKTNQTDSAGVAFKEAVRAVQMTSPGQDLDARSLTHKDAMFDDVRTNREESATHSFSNAVVRFSPPAPPQDFDARSLTNKDAMFDDIRTNREQAVTESFKTAVTNCAGAVFVKLTDSTYTETVNKAAGAVQSNETYTTMAGKANSAVQPDTLVQTVNAVKDLHWDPGLQVTWTNVVNNGHIYYVTVTNTNISAAQ